MFFFLFFFWGPVFAEEISWVEHVDERFGVSIKVPSQWNQKAFELPGREIFPILSKDSFLIVSVEDPVDNDYSNVDLEFYMADLLYLSKKEPKIKDFEYHKTTLSGLSAYDVKYTLEEEKPFKVRRVFASSNEKLYEISYESSKENFAEFEDLFIHQVISSVKIAVMPDLAVRYQICEVPEFGFSFHYPAHWRLIRTNRSIKPVPLYRGAETGVGDFLSSTEGIGRSIRQEAQSEGIFLEQNEPVVIAPDPDSLVAVYVFGLSIVPPYPADAIEGYVKNLREKAKKLEGYTYYRMFPSVIDGNLAMEFSYSYQEKEDGLEKKFYVNNYVTYVNQRVYHIQYQVPDQNSSKYVKGVDQLIKSFQFRSVEE